MRSQQIPRSFPDSPGRAVAMLWMVGSIVAIAVFTAGITSALTVRQLQGTVREVADLSTVRVGAVSGTTAEDVLVLLRVWPVTFATPKAVPLNSPLRKPIGVAVLDATESPWWGQTIFHHTGTR